MRPWVGGGGGGGGELLGTLEGQTATTLFKIQVP